MDELSRIRRVADQMASGYAYLRDQYARRARILDIFLLVVASWLLAMTFADQYVAAQMTPPGFASELWLGVLAIGTFVLALIQSRVDWKAKSEAYQRSLLSVSEIVLEIRELLSSTPNPTLPEVRRITDKYYTVLRFIEPIPEKRFLDLKRRHRLKVEISKMLDDRPSVHVGLLRLRLWWRDNLRGRK